MDILCLNNIANKIKQYKDFIIKTENENYSLRIKFGKEYIFFIVKKINSLLDFYFQKKIKHNEIINKLHLDKNNNLNNDSIFNKIDELNKKNIIKINEIDDDNINIKFEDSNIKFETTLFKKDMTMDDKLNILYNEIKLKQYKNNYKNYAIDNQIKFEYIINKQRKYENNENNKELLQTEWYKKIEKMFEEQKTLYNNIIKELNEIKYIIIEKNKNIEKNKSENIFSTILDVGNRFMNQYNCNSNYKKNDQENNNAKKKKD